jgi:hypothetical protein
LNSKNRDDYASTMSGSSQEPLEQRLTRYRSAAEQARKAALSAQTDEVRASFNSIASSWESLILEAEAALKETAKGKP